jgi:plastocyanin
MNRHRLLMTLAAGLLASALLVALRGSAARAATQNVSVQDDATAGGVFTPKSFTVSVGDTVHWDWAAGNVNPHSVTADGSSFDSDPPPPGYRTSGGYDQTFNTQGTYAYYCRVHGAAGGVGMSGTIVVEAAAPTSTSTPSPAPTDTPAPSNTAVTRTLTPNATDTPVSTATPAPVRTPAAVVAAQASATPGPSGAAGGAAQLPRTGSGRSRGVTPVWPAVAFALGVAGLACVFARQTRRHRP